MVSTLGVGVAEAHGPWCSPWRGCGSLRFGSATGTPSGRLKRALRADGGSSGGLWGSTESSCPGEPLLRSTHSRRALSSRRSPAPGCPCPEATLSQGNGGQPGPAPGGSAERSENPQRGVQGAPEREGGSPAVPGRWARLHVQRTFPSPPPWPDTSAVKISRTARPLSRRATRTPGQRSSRLTNGRTVLWVQGRGQGVSKQS